MPLTPEDVSKKRFTAVRLREGYDMGEVDQFLDEIEAELERLHKESDDLRAKLSAATGGRASDTTVTAGAGPKTEPQTEPRTDSKTAADVKSPAAESTSRPDSSQTTQQGQQAAVSPVSEAPREVIKVVTAAEASSAATRLLELATRNADELVAEARTDAESIVTAARGEAERLESETKTRTDTLEQEARARAQRLDAETDSKRGELLGAMEEERTRLDTEVENLRAFEREYRSRLKSYFHEQLQALDAAGEDGELLEPGDAAPPKRLKSILGGESEQQAGGEPTEGTGRADQPEGQPEDGDDPRA